MSIFGGLGRSSILDRKFSQEEAISAILLSIIASDGEVSDEEVDAFISVANNHPTMRNQSASDFKRMVDEQQSVLRKQGWEKLFDKGAAELPRALAQTVFVLAVDFVLSDGSVDAAEERLIERLRDALSIADDLVGAAVEVLSIKYAVK
mgnify:CR=1 FL=1